MIVGGEHIRFVQVVRTVGVLSFGTILAQALGSLGQIFLAVWLTPSEFGYWATASSALLLLSGVLNFGEVNGFLTKRDRTFTEARESIRKLNWPLVIIGLAIAATFFIRGDSMASILVGIQSITLPLAGESALLYAALVRESRPKILVGVQVLSSAARLIVGVALAITTQSALALGVSYFISFAVMVPLLTLALRKRVARQDWTGSPVTWRERKKWTLQQLMQLVPNQIDYLVLSMIAAPGFLGLYFVSYQVTVSISSLVVAPLSRVTLSTLANEPVNDRGLIALRLLYLSLGAVTLVSGLGIAVAYLFGSNIPRDWLPAIPAIMILLSSLPSRFVTPVSDSTELAQGRWRRSIALHTWDAVGTSAAALTAVYGSLSMTALAMVIWKACFACARLWSALTGVSPAKRVRASGYLMLCTALLCGMSLIVGSTSILLAGFVVPVAILGILIPFRSGSLTGDKSQAAKPEGVIDERF